MGYIPYIDSGGIQKIASYSLGMIKAIKLVLKQGTTFDLYFNDGKVFRYDIISLADKFPQLNQLKDRKLFLKGRLLGWSGVVWNDELDIEAETVYEEGQEADIYVTTTGREKAIKKRSFPAWERMTWWSRVAR